MTVRGENYVAVLDPVSFNRRRGSWSRTDRDADLPPDGKYGYVCSSFNRKSRSSPWRITPSSARSPRQARLPDLAATPDGAQVWFTLKDTGKAQVFDARPPFNLLKTLDTGPITNHVNIVRNANGQFAYITVGGLNEIQVYRTDDFTKVATIPVGKLPHGIWPSGDGSRAMSDWRMTTSSPPSTRSRTA